MGFVISSVAHAKIKNVDWSEALKMSGVVDKVDHTDITGSNQTGHVIKDEEVFASKMVIYMTMFTLLNLGLKKIFMKFLGHVKHRKRCTADKVLRYLKITVGNLFNVDLRTVVPAFHGWLLF